MIAVKFADGTILQGGGWNTLPNKAIQKIALLEKANKGILSNFEAYNHLIEHVYGVSGPINQKSFDRAIFLMGKKGNEVTTIKFNTLTNEMSVEKSIFGQEYNGRSSSGWKQGILDLNPAFKIL